MYQLLSSVLTLDDVASCPLLVEDPEGTLRKATYYQCEEGKVRPVGTFDTFEQAGIKAVALAPHACFVQGYWTMAAYDSDGERAIYLKIEQV